MEPITNVEEAKRAIESFEGGPEDSALPTSECRFAVPTDKEAVCLKHLREC